MRDHFADCGNIKNIRIVRDSKTSLGKGFCYVNFGVSIKPKDRSCIAVKNCVRIACSFLIEKMCCVVCTDCMCLIGSIHSDIMLECHKLLITLTVCNLGLLRLTPLQFPIVQLQFIVKPV